MHRFYADSAAENGFVSLAAEDRSHALRVLRLQPGDEIEVFLSGRRWRAELTVCREEEVTARLLEALPDTEPGLQVTLYQGLPKGEKMELIVQKAVELGVQRIVPVDMQRCIVRLDASGARKKQERWQKIAREACKQSGRVREVPVELPLALPSPPFSSPSQPRKRCSCPGRKPGAAACAASTTRIRTSPVWAWSSGRKAASKNGKWRPCRPCMHSRSRWARGF